MKFPRKLRPIGLAFFACGLLASVSALAARPASGGGVPGPGVLDPLPSYMIVAAALDNETYMKCVASHARNAANVLASYDAALDCKKD